MTPDLLSKHFKGVAAKRLSAVEVDPRKSNQHEFNGAAELKKLFGTEDRPALPAHFVWLSDDEGDLAWVDGFVTWYDARQRHPTRSEHRLYFPGTTVTEKASEGDTLLIAQLNDDSILVVIASGGSSAEGQVRWLFNIENTGNQFIFREVSRENDQVLGLGVSFLLDQLGITPENRDDRLLAEILTRFEKGFPTTAEFSTFARKTAGKVDAVRDPDAALTTFIEHEERLFFMLERKLVGERLEAGFMHASEPDVNGFLKYSLSVHNTRKSRAGRALENHLEHLFKINNIAFSRNCETENRSRPDFLFPNVTNYRDDGFPQPRLTMLAAKYSCKERWRQILAEAKRIEVKHLLTLEPGISEYQTDEMRVQGVQLVVPVGLQPTYAEVQREHLMSVQQFMNLIRTRQ